MSRLLLTDVLQLKWTINRRSDKSLVSIAISSCRQITEALSEQAGRSMEPRTYLDQGRYSVLSARTGSTDAARRAGITPATQAAASSIPTATTNAPLLTVVSSYSCDFTSVTP